MCEILLWLIVWALVGWPLLVLLGELLKATPWWVWLLLVSPLIYHWVSIATI
jgi:hypothetical protein